MDKRPIYLVGCGKSKLKERARACDLYTGQLFRKSYRLARTMAHRNDGAVFILSAKHGLLDPLAPIEPYDLAMSHLGAVERKEWGERVAMQLSRQVTGIAGCRFAILAGRQYVEAVEWGLTELLSYSPEIQTPMHGKGIGSRLAWLTQTLFDLNYPDAPSARVIVN